MDKGDFAGLFLILILVSIWFAPIALILNSSKTSGKEKIAWILAVIFVTWFAWIFYLLLAPIKNNQR